MKTNFLSFMARKVSIPAGKRLAQMRKRRGLTQVELGNLLNISQRMVAYYENDAKKIPTQLLPKLAKILGVSLEELLGGGELPIVEAPKADKRLLKQLEKLEKLSVRDRRMVLRMIDTLAAQKAS